MILPRTKSIDSSPSVNPLTANQLHKLQPPPSPPQHAAAQAVPNAKKILQQMQLQVQRGAEEPFYVVDLNRVSTVNSGTFGVAKRWRRGHGGGDLLLLRR